MASRPRIAVAASGGRDSTALLHMTARAALDGALSADNAKLQAPLEVWALHVHHGLMPQADAWLEQLQAQCARWARRGLPVRFKATRLQGAPAKGESVEAWARKERYQALARMALQEGASTVLLAHHRRDQAETLLLQALRGAGAAGMAGMPREVVRDGVTWVRPWLEMPREAIEAYVKTHRLRVIEDPSNSDSRFARNRLRLKVWPALLEAFPHAEVALAGAAQRLHEADVCAQAMASVDALHCLMSHGSCEGRVLKIAAWRELPAQRQTNLLRFWLKDFMPQGVPDSLVRRLSQELGVARGGACWPAPGGQLVVLRGLLMPKSQMLRRSNSS